VFTTNGRLLGKPSKPTDVIATLETWEGRLKRDAVEIDRSIRAADIQPEPTAAQYQVSPPVDVPAFRAVMEEAGIEAIVEPTLKVFLTETPKIFGGLMAAARAGDASGVNAGAHSLKSSSANIRADPLAQLLAELEMAGRNEDLEVVAVLFPQVESEYAAVLSFLRDRS
jgi:HPt (histidine-containing phosphotransfer) domain-containing protein